jgi:folate-binding protein YgfZ
MPINISTSAAIYRWKPACWLRVSGDDAAAFLQGQFTNDLRTVPATGAVYGLWLTLKGKVLADSVVLRGGVPNEFWVGSYFSASATIRERLESFVIADDVTIEDFTADWMGTTLLGAGVVERSQTDVSPNVLLFRGRRSRVESIECLYLANAGEPAWLPAREDLIELDETEMARRRIEAGIPAIPIDVGPADLPNEAGLEAEAISYTKGCYLGQEVMARLKSMGQVRRRLVRVRQAAGKFPMLPAPVFVGARQVGELRSAANEPREGWIGLAMVSLLHVTPTTNLALAADGPPVIELVDKP